MIERSTPRDTDAVPEADLAEQSVPAYPDEPVLSDEQQAEPDEVERAIVERGEWSANPADVAEQAIAVPLEDDPDADLGY